MKNRIDIDDNDYSSTECKSYNGGDIIRKAWGLANEHLFSILRLT